MVRAIRCNARFTFQVPNSLPGRESVEVEIFGMAGVPAEDLANFIARVGGGGKKPRLDEPAAARASPCDLNGCVAPVEIIP